MVRAGPLRRLRGFLAYLGRRFVEDRCILWAASLSYSTLLALVPLTAVVLAGFSAFPVFDTWFEQAQSFIFKNFVPATGETIQGYVVEFAAQASRLSAVGVAFLVATSFILVAEIERAFNQIWRVRKRRSLASRVAVYWTTLTVGPLMIGGSLAISSYVFSLPLIEGATRSGPGHALLQGVPFLIELLAFTMAYLIVPNTVVPLVPAMIGGLLASGLFEGAKYGFATYVSTVPTYQVIYGALAAIPIFLVWVYLSWTVILLGALCAAALQTFRIEVLLTGWSRIQELQLSFRVTGHLWQAQREGGGYTFVELLKREPASTDDQMVRVLDALDRERIVHEGEAGEWLLTRDPAEVTLLDLYRAGSFPLPGPDQIRDCGDRWDRAFREAVEGYDEPLAEGLSLPLKELYVDHQPAAEGRVEEVTPPEPETAGASPGLSDGG